MSGTGVSAGERRRPDGTQTSALRFASAHPLSLIAEGRGYWRSVDPEGALMIRSGEYRFRERRADFRVPELLGGSAVVRESYDDTAGCFRIQVSVTNPLFGPLFGYEGSFVAEFVDAAELGVRGGVRPVREEARG